MEDKKYIVKWSTITHYEAEVSARDHLDAELKYWDGEVEYCYASSPEKHGELGVEEAK